MKNFYTILISILISSVLSYGQDIDVNENDYSAHHPFDSPFSQLNQKQSDSIGGQSVNLEFDLKKEEVLFGRSAQFNVIEKHDFPKGSMQIDRALAGKIAGLKTIRNSGMPGEGSFFNLRGIRSSIGENSPLIVINGLPFMPDNRESPLISGFSRNIFQSYNINDIKEIRLLKGAEASLYGSLGSNGVILIETEQAASDDLETNVSFYGQYGTSWNDKRLPLLGNLDYKSYLSDVGMSYFDNMESLFSSFPFLSSSNHRYENYYNNQTDWQEEIYQKGFITDNLFRVEGGDAIAKYDLSLGYSLENGTLNNTENQRYHTLLNTNVIVSKNFELKTTFGLAYLTGKFQEQGLIRETNPVLASYHRAPNLSPFNKDNEGNVLISYSPYYFGVSDNMDFASSNPLAIANTLDARNRQYDLTINVGFDYKVLPDLKFVGIFGMLYNYNNEHLFIPGLTDKTILPLVDQFGESMNTVKDGVGETTNSFFNLRAVYDKRWNEDHEITAFAGGQVISSKIEYDAGIGRNTPNDFYQTLGNVQSIGRYFDGYLEKWNWLNFYAHGDYTYKNLLVANLNMSFDGASSAGSYGRHFYYYPSFGITLLGKGWLPIKDESFLNRLNIKMDYGWTGNSRFSSNYGKYYYNSSPYQSISGIVRGNIPNTHLQPELTAELNFALDIGVLRNRMNFGAEYYNSTSSKVIFPAPLSSIYGTANFYDNIGSVKNTGVELSFMTTPVRLSDFEWSVGGNIAFNQNKILSLGEYDEIITDFGDGAQLVSKVGEPMYQFYGYEALGVIATRDEAKSHNLRNEKGLNFEAGDMHFNDLNKDNVIDDRDRTILGNASPDFFGGLFMNFRYKKFEVGTDFVFMKGNKIYNAVRQDLESLSTINNQSAAIVDRWNLEGQTTNIPRAQWNDPVGNSDFSSRWIEDGSYLKMRNVTLSYHLNKKFFELFRSGTFYLKFENMLTFTNYLGLDPEFYYSNNPIYEGFDYGKLVLPKTIKLGVNLNL